MDTFILPQQPVPSNGRPSPADIDAAILQKADELLALAQEIVKEQAELAAELHIFTLENKLARAIPARRDYWQQQLNAAWRGLARSRKAGEQ